VNSVAWLIKPAQYGIVFIMSDKQEGDSSANIYPPGAPACLVNWKVGQILFEGGIGAPDTACEEASGAPSPVQPLPIAFVPYSSLNVQWTRRRNPRGAGYTVLYPRGARSVFLQKDAPLAGKIPDSLRALDKQVQELAGYALRAPVAGKKLVSRILPVLQQIDRSFARFVHAQSREQRIVIDWKDALEKLRCAALGVSVKYSLVSACASVS
jgi:hypothetical protein